MLGVLVFRKLLKAFVGTLKIGLAWDYYLLMNFIQLLHLNDFGSSHGVNYCHFFVTIYLIHRETFLEILEIVAYSTLCTGSIVEPRAGQLTAFTPLILTLELFLIDLTSTLANIMIDQVSISNIFFG